MGIPSIAIFSDFFRDTSAISSSFVRFCGHRVARGMFNSKTWVCPWFVWQGSCVGAGETMQTPTLGSILGSILGKQKEESDGKPVRPFSQLVVRNNRTCHWKLPCHHPVHNDLFNTLSSWASSLGLPVQLPSKSVTVSQIPLDLGLISDRCIVSKI